MLALSHMSSHYRNAEGISWALRLRLKLVLLPRQRNTYDGTGKPHTPSPTDNPIQL